MNRATIAGQVTPARIPRTTAASRTIRASSTSARCSASKVAPPSAGCPEADAEMVYSGCSTAPQGFIRPHPIRGDKIVMSRYLEGNRSPSPAPGRGIGRAVAALPAPPPGRGVVVNDYGVSDRRQRADAARSPTRSSPRSRPRGGKPSPTPSRSRRWKAARASSSQRDRHVRPHRRRRVRRWHPARAHALQHVARTSGTRSIETHLKGTFTVFRAAAADLPRAEERHDDRLHVGRVRGERRAGQLQRRRRAASCHSCAAPRPACTSYGVTANCIAPVGEDAHVGRTCRSELADGRARGRRADGRVILLSRPRAAHHRPGLHGQRRQDRGVEPAGRDARHVQGRPLTPEEIAARLPESVGSSAWA